MNQNPGTTSTASVAAAPSQNLPKEKYRSLKKKFKFLVYENECYQEELRNLQRRLLKLSRDKNFLLDRLMQYEKVSDSSDDSDPPAPATTATKNASESPKPKKQKKSYPSAKKSRAKLPPQTPAIATAAEIGHVQSATPATPANVGAALIRGRSRKGNGAGGSSSEAEAIVVSNPGANPTIIEMDRIQQPQLGVPHYPMMGVYDPQAPTAS